MADFSIGSRVRGQCQSTQTDITGTITNYRALPDGRIMYYVLGKDMPVSYGFFATELRLLDEDIYLTEEEAWDLILPILENQFGRARGHGGELLSKIVTEEIITSLKKV